MSAKTHIATSASPLVRKSMMWLCLVLIALQAADGISTQLALSTGQAEEQNEFLLMISNWLGWPVIETVFAAKIVTAGVFGWAMLKTEPSPMIVGILTTLTLYVGSIVAMNFYWAWTLG
jgi:hypothetical protein